MESWSCPTSHIGHQPISELVTVIGTLKVSCDEAKTKFDQVTVVTPCLLGSPYPGMDAGPVGQVAALRS